MELLDYINRWQKPVFWHPNWQRTIANKTRAMSGTWVYLIEASNSNAVKIGKTKNPERRFCTLDNMNADDLNRSALLNFNLITEKELHDKFLDLNYKGEWFSRDSELCYLLDKLKKGA